jgi:DNA gyrase subunit A
VLRQNRAIGTAGLAAASVEAVVMDGKADDRLHIIDGLLSALARIGDVNRVVGSAAGRDEAKVALIGELGLSDVQANHVLDMTVARLTTGARADLAAEADRLRS